jgi:hypothetical protein
MSLINAGPPTVLLNSILIVLVAQRVLVAADTDVSSATTTALGVVVAVGSLVAYLGPEQAASLVRASLANRRSPLSR